MSKVGLLKAMGGVARAGSTPAPELLGALPGLTRAETVVADAERAGLAATRSANQAVTDGKAAENVVERVEAAVKAAADGSATSTQWLRRITRDVPHRTLGELWKRFSPRDRRLLLGRMVRIDEQGGKVIHNLVAGAMREILAKHLGPVRKIVLDEKARIRELARRGDDVAFLDTGVLGDVELPTQARPAGKNVQEGRDLKLGTDRLIGIARGKPGVRTIETPTGGRFEAMVQGELEVTVAIEVKGRSVIEGGLRQVEALRELGRGTQGYAVIDGKLWFLKYDPAAVHHVIVAPPGEEFARIAAIKQLRGGGRLTVVEIDKALDNELLGFSGALMGALGKVPRTAELAAGATKSAAP